MPPITPEISIQDLTQYYPDTIDILVIEYGFHCVGCFASQFETLQQGAAVHGIVGNDFEELLKNLQKSAVKKLQIEVESTIV